MSSYDHQLKQIEKRRSQLWFLALLLIVVFSMTVVSLSYWEVSIVPSFSNFVNYSETRISLIYKIVRISLILLTVAFCVYVVERQFIFRRLNQRLFDEKVKSASLDNKVKQVSSLLKAGKAVNTVIDLKDRLDIILKSAFDLFGANKGSIMLLDEKTQLLKIVTAYGLSDDIIAKVRIKVGESIAGWVAKRGKPLLLNGDVDPKKYKNFSKKTRYIQSAIIVPLKVKNKNIGVLSISVSGKKSKKFDKYELNTAQVFAEQMAMVIVNSKLYEQTKNSKSRFAALNKALGEKNKELKKTNEELKSANNELAKFNKLTVDRELQMIKLKEEIKRLKIKVS